VRSAKEVYRPTMDPTLEDTLLRLLHADDRRPLVRAMCACARRQLAVAAKVDPRNTTLIETAEGWAAGRLTTVEAREVAWWGQGVPGGIFPMCCLRVIVAPMANREAATRFLAQQLPTAIVMKKRPPPHEGPALIAATERNLCTLAENAANAA
jgi:hypothetical protein